MNREQLAQELVKIAKSLVAVTPTVSVDELMSYENGDMSDEQVIDLFQRLVDNEMAWQLQGAYGRAATQLIRQGLVKRR